MHACYKAEGYIADEAGLIGSFKTQIRPFACSEQNNVQLDAKRKAPNRWYNGKMFPTECRATKCRVTECCVTECQRQDVDYAECQILQYQTPRLYII
jgi:hypothetical protein